MRKFTVLLDGKPVNSCVVPALQTEGRSLTAIEGLGNAGKIDPVQDAMIQAGCLDTAKTVARQGAGIRNKGIYRLWIMLVRYFAPTIVALVFLVNLI